jgi:hypothetical protein
MRLSPAALAFVCLGAGFFLAGTRLKAVEDVSPARFPSDITVGTRVGMSFDGRTGGNVDCTIERIDAGWVRCAPDNVDSFHTVERPAWYAIAHVTDVQRKR